MKNILKKHYKTIILVTCIVIMCCVSIYNFFDIGHIIYHIKTANAEESTEESTEIQIYVNENTGFRENYGILGDQQISVGTDHYLIENIIPNELESELKGQGFYYANRCILDTSDFRNYNYVTNTAYTDGATIIFTKYVDITDLDDAYKELFNAFNPGSELTDSFVSIQDSGNEYIGINNKVIAKSGNYLIQTSVTDASKWKDVKQLTETIISEVGAL